MERKKAKAVEFTTRSESDRWITKCSLCRRELYTLKREGEFTRRFRLAEHSASHQRG